MIKKKIETIATSNGLSTCFSIRITTHSIIRRIKSSIVGGAQHTLLSRIIVPGHLFFFGIFFHPGCLIRDSPLIKITKFYPGRMPNRYSPFIFFKDF